MVGCYTYRSPELLLTKEQEIETLIRNLKTIKSLLKKPNKANFDQREYYKNRYSYFYQKLLSKLNGDEKKVKNIMNNSQNLPHT